VEFIFLGDLYVTWGPSISCHKGECREALSRFCFNWHILFLQTTWKEVADEEESRNSPAVWTSLWISREEAVKPDEEESRNSPVWTPLWIGSIA
jgi:hypothetical protein